MIFSKYKKHLSNNVAAFLIFFTSILWSGCVDLSARLEYQNPPEKSFQKLPFKFYVQDVSLGNLSVRSSERTGRLFSRYWPELFTDNPENALIVSYGLRINSRDNFDPDAFFSLALSFFSYGILPAFDNYVTQAHIAVVIENSFNKTYNLLETGRRATNAGVFAILSTKSLIPKVQGAVFGKSFGDKSLTVFRNREKAFLQLFVDALCSFPKNKILEYYFSNKTDVKKLLD